MARSPSCSRTVAPAATHSNVSPTASVGDGLCISRSTCSSQAANPSCSVPSKNGSGNCSGSWADLTRRAASGTRNTSLAAAAPSSKRPVVLVSMGSSPNARTPATPADEAAHGRRRPVSFLGINRHGTHRDSSPRQQHRLPRRRHRRPFSPPFGRGRQHQPPGADHVPRSRHVEARRRDVLRADRGMDPSPSRGPAAYAGALPRRHRQPLPLYEALEGVGSAGAQAGLIRKRPRLANT